MASSRKTQSDNETLADDLIKAAIKCFDRFSIRKTTVEDICREAKISRPTFYKCFKNKRELILAIAGRETRRLSLAMAKVGRRHKDLRRAFTEVIYFTVCESRKSSVVRFLLNPENLEFTLDVVRNTEDTLMSQHDIGLMPYYEKAERLQLLREGLDVVEITRWLQMLESLLVIYCNASNLNDDELYRIIEKFIVPAILKDNP